MSENQEKSSTERLSQAAGAAKTAMKSGKAMARAAKGAVLGPYGIAAGLAWEGRKFIFRVLLVIVVLLLLPIFILMMLPTAIFGDISDSPDKFWDEAAAEEIILHDDSMIVSNYEDACDSVDDVMKDSHELVLEKIKNDFASYKMDDEMVLDDFHIAELPHDSTRIICEYSAITDFKDKINISELQKKLSDKKDDFFFFIKTEEEEIRSELIPNGNGGYTETETPYTKVTYTVAYVGDDYITDEIFMLTEEQTELAADLADSLNIYTGGKKHGS